MKPENEEKMDQEKHFPSHFGEVYDAMPEKFEKRVEQVQTNYLLGTDSCMCIACHFSRMVAIYPLVADTGSWCCRSYLFGFNRIGRRP